MCSSEVLVLLAGATSSLPTKLTVSILNSVGFFLSDFLVYNV